MMTMSAQEELSVVRPQINFTLAEPLSEQGAHSLVVKSLTRLILMWRQKLL